MPPRGKFPFRHNDAQLRLARLASCSTALSGRHGGRQPGVGNSQLPLYTIWRTGSLGEKAFAVLHYTGGDLLIGLSALTVALVLTGDDEWPERGFARTTALTIALGVGYTIFSEWLNIVVRAAWQYSELMPVVPVIGTGLSPLLQWLLVPTASLYVARRAAG